MRKRIFALGGVAILMTVVAMDAGAQTAPDPSAIVNAWKISPHANVRSEAFTHWDKEGAVPVPCATCHSGAGFRDFLGADGSTPGKVDRPAAIHSVIGCDACHNDKAKALSRVTFPSGITVDGLDGSARCMVCHQGRQSGADVGRSVAGIGADTVSEKLAFLNVHYRAAGATLYGTAVKGGFEYPGKAYRGKLKHPANVDSCVECHDAHTTKVKAAACGACHKGQALRSIRTTKTDFDGDGNVTEGMAEEIATLHGALADAIRAYAKTVIGAPIAYEPSAHPYFFADTNGNGVADKAEATRANVYKKWTPRLLQAAYNYQFVAKEPGAYAHNAQYAVQLLYDSIESLSQKAQFPAFAKMRRP